MNTLVKSRHNVCFKRHFGNKQAHCKLLRDTLMTSTQITNKDCLDLQTALELHVTAF